MRLRFLYRVRKLYTRSGLIVCGAMASVRFESLEEAQAKTSSEGAKWRLEKEHLARVGVPLGPYMEVAPPTAAGVAAVAATFGFPLMLKSRLGAYDGKGNAVVRSEADIEAAMEALGGGSMLYAEKWVPFAKELAVMVARSTDGSVVAHPVVETVQRNNVCHIVTTEGITPTERDATSAIAMQAISSLDGAGIYGVELFLLEDGSVLLNEIAPRPHNSGHYTIEACVTCQFEQHLRAVLGLPLGDPSLKVGCAAMVNILGDLAGAEGEARAVGQLTAALSIAGASGHWYGKAGCRPGRKMGHITVVADDAAQLKVRLDAVLAACE